MPVLPAYGPQDLLALAAESANLAREALIEPGTPADAGRGMALAQLSAAYSGMAQVMVDGDLAEALGLLLAQEG
jgi:hypothetical protein